jgi:hypothetical protein
MARSESIALLIDKYRKTRRAAEGSVMAIDTTETRE